MTSEVYIKSGEAARLLGVSVGTLGRWHDRGILIPAQVMPSGRKRYSMSQVQDFITNSEIQSDFADTVDSDEVYMTSKEVSKYAGLTISMINSLGERGCLVPRRRIPTNNRRLFAKSDVDAFIATISTR